MSHTIAPYLLYEDGAAAVAFLSNAFGFEEKERMTESDGRVRHAELALGDGTVYLGQPEGDFQSPKRLGSRTVLVHVYVDDVDAHSARARAAGADIVEEPADQGYGERRYAAEDPEGHVWYFARRAAGDDRG
jgi:uncharacterized glyoxalase superfamily protein PhnB